MSTIVFKQTEKQFEAALVQYAKLAGWRVYHSFDSRRSEAGWPDLSMVRLGRLVFAELKTEKGRLSGAQLGWQEALLRVAYSAANVEVFVWRPSDWSEIESVLGR